jgi:Ulp1 family protease
VQLLGGCSIMYVPRHWSVVFLCVISTNRRPFCQLFIPINIKGEHWIAARVDFRGRHIQLYDSYIANESNAVVMKTMECLPVIISWMMGIGTPFTMERMVDGIPQQPTASGTCGVYSSRFIEFLAFDVPLMALEAFSATSLRRRFALDLFEGRRFAR